MSTENVEIVSGFEDLQNKADILLNTTLIFSAVIIIIMILNFFYEFLKKRKFWEKEGLLFLI